MIHIRKTIASFEARPIVLKVRKSEIEQAVVILFEQMFPVCEHLSTRHTRAKLRKANRLLYKNIARQTDKVMAKATVEQFFERLTAIQTMLVADAQSFVDSDPAAASLEEVVIAYPGFFALVVHRLAHELYLLKTPLIPRIMSEYAHSKVGIDIHPGAQIGANFFLDHGTGVVIGETAVIGDNVKLYQGVTLGALFVDRREAHTKRHPTVENDVVIYAGATILGGETVIGHNSVVGGNSWITASIVPFSVVQHAIEMKVKDSRHFQEPLNFVI